jgi:hypothetical protein
MMQLAPRASLVVVLLLASVGTASAECAWVLWTETHQAFLKSDDRRPTTKEWELDTDVHDSRGGCESTLTDKMTSTLRSFQKSGATIFQPPGEAPEFFIRLYERRVAIQKRGSFFLIYTYACLLDTVDPRGPKGK